MKLFSGKPRIQFYIREFVASLERYIDALEHSGPDAVRLALIKFVDAEPQFPMPDGGRRILRQKTAMIWQFIVEAPFVRWRTRVRCDRNGRKCLAGSELPHR